MLDLSHKLKDELIVGSERYELDLSFDNVLRVFDMLQDEEISDEFKPYLALVIFTKQELDNFTKYNFEDIDTILKEIFQEHIENEKLNPIEYDLAGNPMPERKGEEEEQLYSLKYDSDYIFASFFQAYNIDLIEQQGKLHWKKFNALLNGLPDGTKFVEVIKIRSWKPSKSDSSEYKDHMRKLQRLYELPIDD